MNLSTLKFTDQSNGEVDGKKFEFVACKSISCEGCIFLNLNKDLDECRDLGAECDTGYRTDTQNGVFKFTTP